MRCNMTDEEIVADVMREAFLFEGAALVSRASIKIAMTKAVQLARADEREKCAKVCEQIELGSWAEYKTGNGPGRACEHVEGISDGAAQCAAAIRAGGKKALNT